MTVTKWVPIPTVQGSQGTEQGGEEMTRHGSPVSRGEVTEARDWEEEPMSQKNK